MVSPEPLGSRANPGAGQGTSGSGPKCTRARLILSISCLEFSQKISFKERILWLKDETLGSHGSGPGFSFSREQPDAHGRAEPCRGHTMSVT